MRASPSSASDRSFDVLLELEGHPLPTFIARTSPAAELVVVERHTVAAASRVSVLEVATSLERFRHPNVAAVRDVLDTIGVISVVSTYLEGELLSSFDAALGPGGKRARLGVELRILLDVLAALSALRRFHDAGRRGASCGGMTPNRVVVGTDGRCRLIHLQSPLLRTSQGGSDADRFVAPEVTEASLETGEGADVYAAGVWLAELLAGEPFDAARPFLLQHEGAGLPAWSAPLADVVRRAVAANPGERLASTLDMATRVRAVAGAHAASYEAVAAALGATCGDTLAARRARLASACHVPLDTTPQSLRPGAGLFGVEAPTHPTAALVAWPAEPETRPAHVPVPPREASPRADAPSERSTPSTGGAREHAPVPRLDAIPPPLAGLTPHGGPPRASLPATSLLPTSITRLASVSDSPVPQGSDVVAAVEPLQPTARRRRAAVMAASAIALVAVFSVGALLLSRASTSDSSRSAAPAPTSSGGASAASSSRGDARRCPAGMVAIVGASFARNETEPPGASGSKHVGAVSVSSFCIDALEVAVSDFKKCSDRGDCKRALATNDWIGITHADRIAYDPTCTMSDPIKYADRPITCVDWERADIYCQAKGGHLPTEAQWELAARGAEGRLYPWGASPPSSLLLNACGRECVGWGAKNHVELLALHDADDGFPNAAPVGSFPKGATPDGVQDLAGNVAEWLADWSAAYPAEDQKDPSGPPAGEARVVRGGGWNLASAERAATSYRGRELPTRRSYNLGFRCAAPVAGP